MAAPWGELRSVGQDGSLSVPIPLDFKEVLIGRSSNARIVMPLPEISGEHCLLSFRVSASTGKREPFIVDLSTNGTFLNRKRIEKGKRKMLKTGDLIALTPSSAYVFQFTSLLDQINLQDYLSPGGASISLPASPNTASAITNPPPAHLAPVPTMPSLPVSEHPTAAPPVAVAVAVAIPEVAAVVPPPQPEEIPAQTAATAMATQPPNENYHRVTLESLRTLEESLSSCDGTVLGELARSGTMIALIDAISEIELRPFMTPDDQVILQLSLSCVRIMLNEPMALGLLFGAEPQLAAIVSWLDNPMIEIDFRVQVAEMLAGLAALSEDGVQAVLKGFDLVARRRGEKQRFRLLCNLVLTEINHSFQIAIISLINSIVGSPENLNTRLQIRQEFQSLNIEHCFRFLMTTENADLLFQISCFRRDQEEDERIMKTRNPNDPLSLISMLIERTVYTPAYENLTSILQRLMEIPPVTTPAGAEQWQKIDMLVQHTAGDSSAAAVAEADRITRHFTQQMNALVENHDELLRCERAKYEELLARTQMQKQADDSLIRHLQSSLVSSFDIKPHSSGTPPKTHSTVALPNPAAAGSSFSERRHSVHPQRPMQIFRWTKIPPSSLSVTSIWSRSAWDRIPIEPAELEELFSAESPLRGLNLPTMIGHQRMIWLDDVLHETKIAPDLLVQSLFSSEYVRFSPAQLQTVKSALPSAEEYQQLQQLPVQEYLTQAELTAAERVWLHAAATPALPTKLEVLLYFATVPEKIASSQFSSQTLNAAISQIVSSNLLASVLGLLLGIGNFCNYNAQTADHGATDGFKLGFLSQLGLIHSTRGDDLLQYLAAYLNKNAPPLIGRMLGELDQLEAATRFAPLATSKQIAAVLDEFAVMAGYHRDFASNNDPFSIAIIPLYAAASLQATQLQTEAQGLSQSITKLSEYFSIAPEEASFDSLLKVLWDFVSKLSRSSDRSLLLIAQASKDYSSSDRNHLLNLAFESVKQGTIRRQRTLTRTESRKNSWV